MGLADVEDAFHRFKISKLCSGPLCQNVEEGAMWATQGVETAEILQDTRSYVIPRPATVEEVERSSSRTKRKFFYVYVDNLAVLGTSRENVDGDLEMSVETLKSCGHGHTC